MKNVKQTITAIAMASLFASTLLMGGCATTTTADTADMEALIKQAEMAAAKADDAAMRAEKAADRAERMADKSEMVFNQKMKK